MIEAGTVLQNRYLVNRQIGQGGMGAVFVATDERFGSTVAIKETFFTDESFRKAFEREAKLLNSLRHPALPRVSDHFTEGNGQFLVMEFIAGEDLFEMLERGGKPFALKDVLNWADQLLDALDYLHTQERPVIHRDIKPQNLKLAARNQIILLDFGLAKGNPTDAAGSQSTAAQSVFGYSRNYASLEQIQGTGTDPRSDLYALAATLYHLLTGSAPEDALTRAMSVLSGGADPLAHSAANSNQIPPRVAEVLRKAMALDTNQRFASAVEMRRALDASAKNLDWSDAETLANRRAPANFSTRDTELFAAPQNLKQSAIATEVISDNPSLETSVRTKIYDERAGGVQAAAGDTSAKKSRRNLAVGATAFVVLLVACSLAAGVYLFNSTVADSNETNGAGVERKTNLTAAPKENDNAAEESSNTATIETAADAAAPTNAETSVKIETEKPAQKKTTESGEPNAAAKTGKQTIIIQTNEAGKPKPPEIEPPAPPEPPAETVRRPNIPPVSPEVFRNLPPRQRRALKEAMRRQQEQNRNSQFRPVP